MATCSCPGCDQPGTNLCSACKATPYCGPICQTADWAHHKEECPGHLRKTGMAHLQKAEGYKRQGNWPQALRYAELAQTKLKLLKDRPLEEIDDALTFKICSLRFLGRHREAMENAKERYTLWAMTNIRNPNSIWAAFDLIDCCLHLEEFIDAELYARTAYEIINEKTDNIIPMDQRQQLLARGAHYLAQATLFLAQNGGIAPEAKQAAGMKAIALQREALELSTQRFGAGSDEVALNMSVLADIFQFFNDVVDDEVLRLYEQAKAIYAREQGSSLNVAACENNLGAAYMKRALRALNADDLDQELINLELALHHNRESARIYKAIKHAESAEKSLRSAAFAEKKIREVRTLMAARTAGVGASTR